MSVSLIHPNNYTRCHDGGQSISQFTVDGGFRFNAGEEEDSTLVLKHHKTLERVKYWPLATKGGCLPRPYYCHGDRLKSLEFPALKELSVTSWAASVFQYGWIAPQLETLCVWRQPRAPPYGSYLGRDYSRPHFTRKEYVVNMHMAFPALKCIHFYDEDQQWEQTIYMGSR